MLLPVCYWNRSEEGVAIDLQNAFPGLFQSQPAPQAVPQQTTQQTLQHTQSRLTSVQAAVGRIEHGVRSPLLAASLRPQPPRPQPPRFAVTPQSGAQNLNAPCGQLHVVDEQTCSDTTQQRSAVPHGQLQLASNRYSPYPAYNSRFNYLRRGTSNANSNQRSLSQPVTGRSTARRAGHATAGRKFNRTVVIVDSSDTNVPRGKRRRQLHELGMIVNFVDFWTNWNQSDVYHTIETAFQGAIDTTKPYPRWVCLHVSKVTCIQLCIILVFVLTLQNVNQKPVHNNVVRLPIHFVKKFTT